MTRLQNVSFTIEDSTELREQARELAVEDLMAKAQPVAVLAGVDLGPLTYITESGGPGPVSFNTSKAVMAFAESAPTPILSGQMTVSVNVLRNLCHNGFKSLELAQDRIRILNLARRRWS